MILVCIDRDSYHLTVGKKYDARPVIDKYFDYIITNDIGYSHHVEKRLFENLSLIRLEKLKELGI